MITDKSCVYVGSCDVWDGSRLDTTIITASTNLHTVHNAILDHIRDNPERVFDVTYILSEFKGGELVSRLQVGRGRRRSTKG